MKNILFLDVCCGPCLSGVFPQIRKELTVFPIFQGDNINSYDEFLKREENFIKYLNIYNIKNFYIKKYNHDEWLDFIKGFENEKEGGKRCEFCFEYRIKNLLNILKENFDIFFNDIIKDNLDEFIKNNNFLIKKKNKNYLNLILQKNLIFYISTTLSVSKYKSYEKIKRIYSDSIFDAINLFNFDIIFLDKNFSNNYWYNKSIKISKALNLYRQNYCGCEFSIKKKKR